MKLEEKANHIVRILSQAGHVAYFAGGWVRDLLLGIPSPDIDIATSATPEEVKKLFPKTISVGIQFGIVVVIVDKTPFEVATFRADGDYADGRRPKEVKFADAQTDASRRDFTVNGLFLNPLTNKVYDWVGGETDLKSRTLRTIGDPVERFGEDHLRLLRAVRFAAQLDFQIYPMTFSAVQEHAAKVVSVSAERIRDELLKLFRPTHAARGLDLLRESGLLEHVLPELIPTIDCEQTPDYHPEGNVYNHIRLMLDTMPPDAPMELPWTILLHDVAKPATASTGKDGRIHFYGHERVGATMTKSILARLRFSSDEIDTIVFTVRHHMQFKDAPQMRKATLRRMLMRPNFELELEQHRIDCLGSHGKLDIYDFIRIEQVALAEQPDLFEPLVSGRDLIALGMAPGPALGKLLNEIRDRQLAEEFASRENALAWVKEKAAL